VEGGWTKRLGEALRRYLVAGVLAFAPLGITIWAVAWIIQRLDNLLLPSVLAMFGLETPTRVPLVGAVFTLVVILLMGVVARHLFGGELVRAWENLLSRVPVARNIYAGVKQLFEAIFRQTDQSQFNRVVLVEYPRRGIYAIAFTTGPSHGRLAVIGGKQMINCFLPTTPNPTSGYYLLVPEEDLQEVNLSVEDAFKLVMSAGLVSPDRTQEGGASEAARAANPEATGPEIRSVPAPK
jgi:uncharacterized membrane protein